MEDVQQIPIKDIIADQYQPRLYSDPQAEAQLAEWIAYSGRIDPLLGFFKGNVVVLLRGRRRLKVAQGRGDLTVPVQIIREPASELDKMELALGEDSSREGHSEYERVLWVRRMLEQVYGEGEALLLGLRTLEAKQGQADPLTPKEQRVLGVLSRHRYSPSTFRLNMARVLDKCSPLLQEALEAGEISFSVAKLLLPLAEAEQAQWLERFRQGEPFKALREHLNKQRRQAKAKAADFRPNFSLLQQHLRRYADMPAERQRQIKTQYETLLNLFKEQP